MCVTLQNFANNEKMWKVSVFWRSQEYLFIFVIVLFVTVTKEIIIWMILGANVLEHFKHLEYWWRWFEIERSPFLISFICVERLCICQVVHSNSQEDIQEDIWPKLSVKGNGLRKKRWVNTSRQQSVWSSVWNVSTTEGGYSFHRWRVWWSKSTQSSQRKKVPRTPWSRRT